MAPEQRPLPPGDDPSIQSAERLWRRINPDWWKFDPQKGFYRVTSAAFNDSSDGDPMSVILASATTQAEALAGFEGYGLAEFTAGLAREECYCSVKRTPKAGAPWHVSIIGTKTDAIRKHLQKNCTIIVEPTPK